jgi:rod shape-determining protein MreD
MATIFLIPIVYLAALLESWLAPQWEIRGVVPSLLALVAFQWLASARSQYAFLVVALIGLVSDLDSSAPLGVGMGAFAVVGYAIVFLRRNLHLEGMLAQLIIVGSGTMTTCAVQGIALRLTGQVERSLLAVIEHSALVGLYTTGLAIPVMMIACWIKPKREQSPIVAPTA